MQTNPPIPESLGHRGPHHMSSSGERMAGAGPVIRDAPERRQSRMPEQLYRQLVPDFALHLSE